MDEIAFFKAIQGGSLSGAYLLHGEEDYSKERAVRQCMALVDGAARDMNVQQLKAPGADAVIAACETLPFFDRLRVVVVSELAADAEAQLAPYAEKTPESALLLVVRRGTVQKTAPLWKALDPAGRVVEFPRCDQGRAVAFLGKRAKEQNVLLDRVSALHLADVAGLDMATLENSLLKLAAYVGPGNAVTRDAIDACITPSPEYSIFQILECLVAGNLKTGLAMLQKELRDGGQAPLQVASFLEGRAKLMLAARQMLARRMPDADIIRTLGGSPYAARKTLAAAKRSRTERLQTAVLAFAAVDAQLKQGLLDGEDALLIAVYQSFSEAVV